PGLRSVERSGHRENRAAVLNGHHPSRRKAAAVAVAVYFVDDRNAGIARPHEVAVQRMGLPAVDRSRRRNKCLADDLPAVDALPADLWTFATEQVHFKRFEIERRKQRPYGRAHRFPPARAGLVLYRSTGVPGPSLNSG